MRSKPVAVSDSATERTPDLHDAQPLPRLAAAHVLIADGDDSTRSARETQLRAAGWRVSVARTCFEAIVKASCHLPDVVLLDNSLADIEPAETARLLKTCPVTAHITIVRLSHRRRLPRRLLTDLARAAV
jgi:CheY-like chemotaxis protein